MHGDDVASAGVTMTTEVVSKATEIIMEMLKLAIEKERNAKLTSGEKSKGLSGGEVTYQRLKEGGEVTMLPSFAKEDYGELLKRAKKMDISVAAIQEQGKENTLSVFFNVKDEQAVNAIVQDIVRDKLKQPEQTERMITIEKDHVEAFQMACAKQDIDGDDKYRRLMKVPPIMRKAFYMYKVLGMYQDEISSELSIPQQTISYWIGKIAEILK